MSKVDKMFGAFRSKKHQPITVGSEPEGVLDTASSTWAFVKKWAEDEINTLRRKNDSIKNSPDVTAMLRGRIFECKKLLDIPKERGNV